MSFRRMYVCRFDVDNGTTTTTTTRPQRVELSLQGKEADEKARREGDTLSMEKKFLELMKRKLRKKRAIAEAARQVSYYCRQTCRETHLR